MSDPHSFLAQLRRPRLLVRAARFGADDYRRAICLPRLFVGEQTPAPGKAFQALVAREAAIDALRRANAAEYSVARHIEILIALIEEAKLIAPPLPKVA